MQAHAAVGSGPWSWPVTPVGLTRDYLAPATEYGVGHRGIDLRAAPGQQVVAVHDGRVDFSGLVATVPTVVVVHDGGWRSSYQPASALLPVGTWVQVGQRIAVVATPYSHCACLHLGLKFEGRYLSPRAVLGGIPRAIILPW
jgi:murein DD-endopeptidase MepM/ murein hydrolase activator NlpD